jgi:tRNA nucleotidyltransferase (CCA-adding enzyme)
MPVSADTIDGRELLRRLADVPGGRELLAVAVHPELAELEPELVGGAVRDLVLGGAPRELDVVVSAGSRRFLDALVAAVGGQADAEPADGDPGARETRSSAPPVEHTFHERFLTGSLSSGDVRVDVATRRAESYPAPGALPEVSQGTPEEDLRRRDFTVNAISLSLAGPERGRVRAVNHAFEDLRERRLRVLHEESFRDDPTRLLRLGRYTARLALEPEPHTLALARQALAEAALKTVSGGRVGAELRLALNEPDGVPAVAALDRLGVLKALDPRLAFEADIARAALSLLQDSIDRGDARQDLLLLGAILMPMLIEIDDEIYQAPHELLDWLEFPAGDRDTAIWVALGVRPNADQLSRAEDPSDLYNAASHLPLEAIALAGAWGEHQDWLAVSTMAARWLDDLRHVRLRITGKDLIDAGIPEGWHIGRALERTLEEHLDGDLPDDFHAQLAIAVDRARAEIADSARLERDEALHRQTPTGT